MKQLKVFCEGQSEQAFCRKILQPHLFPAGNGLVHTLPVGHKDHHHVHGLGRKAKYEKLRKFIVNSINAVKTAPDVFFTTCLDLYALPDEFPGKAESVSNPANPVPYVTALEAAFGDNVAYHRFIPHIQLYEFETMLFAAPEAFEVAFENCADAVQELTSIANRFQSIEYIDDGRTTAPSKRIIALIPEYDGRKATAGPDIASAIGIFKIREKCPHFSAWIKRLETIDWPTE